MKRGGATEDDAAWPASRLGRILADLEQGYGVPVTPHLADPFEMILWEIVAYLASDEKRSAAFEALRQQIGLTPRAILAASEKHLGEITRAGGSIAVDERTKRLKVAADLVLDKYGGDLTSVLRMPCPKAKKALMEFPMIGEPGAEKILLFCGSLDVLALESNGLRALVRLGVGEDRRSYAATYRSVRDVTSEELPVANVLLQRAHLLLRRHGQECCFRTSPACAACPVRNACAYYAARAQ